MLVLRMLRGTLPNRGRDYNGLSHEPAGGMEEKRNGGVLQARDEESAAPQQKAADSIAGIDHDHTLRKGEMSMNIKTTAFLFVIGIAVIMIAGADPSPAFAEQSGSISRHEALESRVQVLEDREEIRQLLMDYGRFLDQRDFGAFSGLFAKTEGEWIGGMGRAKGSQAIRELMESTIGKDTSIMQSCHLFTNETIHINGDQATALTKWIFVVPGESNRPQLVFLGHYEDSMIRENGRWRFLRRVVRADIPTDNQIKTK